MLSTPGCGSTTDFNRCVREILDLVKYKRSAGDLTDDLAVEDALELLSRQLTLCDSLQQRQRTLIGV
jgi:hypothetical protein